MIFSHTLAIGIRAVLTSNFLMTEQECRQPWDWVDCWPCLATRTAALTQRFVQVSAPHLLLSPCIQKDKKEKLWRKCLRSRDLDARNDRRLAWNRIEIVCGWGRRCSGRQAGVQLKWKQYPPVAEQKRSAHSNELQWRQTELNLIITRKGLTFLPHTQKRQPSKGECSCVCVCVCNLNGGSANILHSKKVMPN